MSEEQSIKKVKVSIDASEVVEKAQELEKLLKSANSLANELAESVSKLKINIEG